MATSTLTALTGSLSTTEEAQQPDSSDKDLRYSFSAQSRSAQSYITERHSAILYGRWGGFAQPANVSGRDETGWFENGAELPRRLASDDEEHFTVPDLLHAGHVVSYKVISFTEALFQQNLGTRHRVCDSCYLASLRTTQDVHPPELGVPGCAVWGNLDPSTFQYRKEHKGNQHSNETIYTKLFGNLVGKGIHRPTDNNGWECMHAALMFGPSKQDCEAEERENMRKAWCLWRLDVPASPGYRNARLLHFHHDLHRFQIELQARKVLSPGDF